MIHFCFLVLSFDFIAGISASHWIDKPERGVKLIDEDSQSINARSPIECILKCRNKFDKKAFYTDKNLCFCTDENFTKTPVALNQTQGKVYSKREEKKITFLDDFEIPGRK